MTQPQTREPQYQFLLDLAADPGVERLGLMFNEAWSRDPRRALFVLARYKFVAKMLRGRRHVLEIGCADAFGARLVQQEVARLTATDFDPVFIADAQARRQDAWPLDLRVHDFTAGPLIVDAPFDAAYALDVLEHIQPADEAGFLGNIVKSLAPTGVLIIGMPSLESQAHASPQSRQGHVNCKSGADLCAVMQSYFDNVFMFSMNDEVLHTGFFPMSHYLLALCCGPRTPGAVGA